MHHVLEPGGSAAAATASLLVSLEGCVLAGNSAARHGGALYAAAERANLGR